MELETVLSMPMHKEFVKLEHCEGFVDGDIELIERNAVDNWVHIYIYITYI